MGIMLKLSTKVKKISQVPLNVKALIIIFFDFSDEISTFDRFLKRNTTWQICVAFVKQFGKNVQNYDKELVQQKGADQKGFKIKKIIFSSILYTTTIGMRWSKTRWVTWHSCFLKSDELITTGKKAYKTPEFYDS